MSLRKVLIIDDEDSTRTAVRLMLEDAGYDVSEAPNGLVGLELLRATDESTVVLLDLMMPTMSGLRMLQEVGSEPELAARHDFILFTAARAFSAKDLALYLPAKRLGSVPKPFDMDDLIAAVDQVAHHLVRESAGEAVPEAVAEVVAEVVTQGLPGAARSDDEPHD